MVFVSTHTVNVLIAWDWKTGDVVRVIGLRLTSALIFLTIAGSQAVQRKGRFSVLSISQVQLLRRVSTAHLDGPLRRRASFGHV